MEKQKGFIGATIKIHALARVIISSEKMAFY